MDMSIRITTDAALDDATQIDAIVAKISESMETLNGVIEGYIPDRVQTEWALAMESEWHDFYGNEGAQSLEDMKLSAENLRTAVQAAIEYSRG